MKDRKKLYIIICLVLLVVIFLIYTVQEYKTRGIISGVVIKDGISMPEDLGFHQTYYNAVIRIYELSENKDERKLVKDIRSDKDGKFTTTVHPGKYEVIVHYGDDLKSDVLETKVNYGKVSWVKVHLRNINK